MGLCIDKTKLNNSLSSTEKSLASKHDIFLQRLLCCTWFQPLLVSRLSFQRLMCAAGKCRSAVFMYILYMIYHTLPFCLHLIWISCRGGSCSPVEMVNNGWPPQLQILTAPLFGSSIQCFLYTCSRADKQSRANKLLGK